MKKKKKYSKGYSNKREIIRMYKKRRVVEEHRKIIFADSPDVPV